MEKSILDLGEVLMQDFHNECSKNKCCDKAEMLLTDIKSLVYNPRAR